MISFLAQLLPEGADLGDVVTPLTLLGVVGLCIRLALSAHDKRATVAEEREKICTTALSSTTVTIEALTTEVRANGASDKVRLEPIERGIAELLDHARHGR